ncbi:MAG: hypothetical protein DRH10_00695 [Deltaproteobacteria bacterium]|nr:MAG: hypothetical protein DRH10_00695 [Deltaproteobacteria bacterium]RLC88361.1 MAG: hypothetical protein DRJ03_02910 [Chloroflexota bacterium]
MIYVPIPTPPPVFPSVPTQFEFDGDKIAGEKLIGEGRALLYALQTEIALQDGMQTGFKEKEYSDGTKIRCYAGYGTTKVKIFVPVKKTRTEPAGKESCYCACGVTAGTIFAGPADNEESPEDWIPQDDSRYSAKLCKETRFEMFDGDKEIIPFDFFPHRGHEPDAEGKATRTADIAYAMIQDTDVEDDEGIFEHVKLEEISPCRWRNFRLVSLEVMGNHKPVMKKELT